MDSLQGQAFLVTGASKGLGKSLSVKLAQKGARVLLLAR